MVSITKKSNKSRLSEHAVVLWDYLAQHQHDLAMECVVSSQKSQLNWLVGLNFNLFFRSL
jgi:hypothetical protein